jgi:hypothetical protein
MKCGRRTCSETVGRIRLRSRLLPPTRGHADYRPPTTIRETCRSTYTLRRRMDSRFCSKLLRSLFLHDAFSGRDNGHPIFSPSMSYTLPSERLRASSSMRSTRLLGRISSQRFPIHSKDSFRVAAGAATDHPEGTSLNSGHSEYCCSALTSTRYVASSRSNGFVMYVSAPLLFDKSDDQMFTRNSVAAVNGHIIHDEKSNFSTDCLRILLIA